MINLKARNRKALEQHCLDLAIRHFSYINIDSQIGQDARSFRTSRAHSFYSAMFENLGFVRAKTQLIELTPGEDEESIVSSRENKPYFLKDVFYVMKVKDPAMIFDVLEYSGAQVNFRNVEGLKGYYVEAKGVQQILDYLTQRGAMHSRKLQGGIKNER